MKKTALWVVTGALLASLLIGAAIGRMAGGGSADTVATWSPPVTATSSLTPTSTIQVQPTLSATPVP